jgi:hypothetical protein
MQHDVSKELNEVFFEPTGDDQINNARIKFNYLQVVEPKLKGFFIRDNVSKTDEQHVPPGLKVYHWSRKEIENYLIIPSVLEKFVRKMSPGELFTLERTKRAKQYLRDNLPPKVYNNPLNNDIDGKGSDFLDKFFREVDIKINKGDYWQIADVMDESEIHPDIKKMLTDLQKAISDSKN